MRTSKLNCFLQICLSSLLLGLLVSCAKAHGQHAPIINGWHLPNGQHSRYKVQRGDTLYSIAWAFDMDFRELAERNHLSPPYAIRAGQILSMAPATAAKPIAAPSPIAARTLPNKINKTPSVALIKQPLSKPTRPMTTVKAISANKPVPVKDNANVSTWLWPAQGKISQGFRPVPGGNKGINIAGKVGEPVKAAAAGKVVYCGSSLPGYGNLVIVKHSEAYLSAYANNKILLVKEGQQVKAGQMLAQMGIAGNGRPELHFEIRLNGKPIDPSSLLKK